MFAHLDFRKLEEYLRDIPESLFHLDQESAENFSKHDMKEESAKKYNLSFDVAAHLIIGKTEGLLERISADLDLVPDHIHSWCNKAMYHVLKEEREESIEALEKVMELQKQPLPYAWSKMSYSYWMAERDRSDHAREKAYDMFQRVIDESKNIEEEGWKELYFDTVVNFLKVSVRHLKDKQNDQEWETKMVKKIVDLLIQMLESSDPNREETVWLWLSEIYSSRYNMRLRIPSILSCCV